MPCWGDIILAEPGALVGFAGPRVIEQTIGQKLPKGFQRSEFLLEHGFVDRIVEREEMKEVLSQILKLHEDSGKVAFEMNTQVDTGDMRIHHKNPEKTLTAWDRVQLSRRKDRPVGSDYIRGLFTDFIEFHGDRYFKDDKAIVGGNCPVPRDSGDGHCPGKRQKHQGKHDAELRHALSGRLPEGPAAHERGGKNSTGR